MNFIIFCDTKGKDNGINKKVLNNLLKSSKKYAPSPDFIVICGDSIAGSKDTNILKLQLEDFNSTINKHYPNTQLLPVIGDNEVKNNTVTYREYGHQEQITVTIDEFVKLIEDRINNLK